MSTPHSKSRLASVIAILALVLSSAFVVTFGAVQSAGAVSASANPVVAKKLVNANVTKKSKGKVLLKNGTGKKLAICYGKYGFDPAGPCKIMKPRSKKVLKTKLDTFNFGIYAVKAGKPTGMPLRDGYVLNVQK